MAVDGLPRKGDVWSKAGRFTTTATFLDNGDADHHYSVRLDGPTYFEPCATYVDIGSLVADRFTPDI